VCIVYGEYGVSLHGVSLTCGEAAPKSVLPLIVLPLRVLPLRVVTVDKLVKALDILPLRDLDGAFRAPVMRVLIWGVWCMVYMVYGVYGVWCMVYGVYGVSAYGAYCMG
jgi:hypothetical protein